MIRRVVTTTCSNTEIVCALGCADRLVGVDDHSDYPPDVVDRLPRVGPDLGVDPARVAALEPDLVIASLTVPGHEHVVESLRAAGLPVIAPQPTALPHVARDIRDIAARLGVSDRGEALASAFETELAAGAALPSADPPRILVEWWPKPVIVPGRHSWVTELIALAGGVNPFGAEDCESAPIDADRAQDLAPDAVVISWCGVPTAKYRPSIVAQRPGWSDLPAVRSGRIVAIPEAYLGRPGPRLIDGLRALRDVVASCRAADRARG